ncbi:2-hydroxychromene-2-carboxylate isomerase [Albidovulum sp.]|uniref:2-hydroxychromene-2-carboxylate isomerase n=1 Tax=Albidovulum sp. TaxID=1872424 RepID=UPI001D9D7C87|nr:2-hydroxychromene-2-carboxylate isomerase [Paracoccaceae bacterium]MCC0047422.1 2-hydroxychromene-2-carboxylate isomerase [Defluviimonas sp.]HPE26865.1 2-hydroxychromene-2-carboxylate isomerase [Albidovulum sp.]MCB2121023.1 2-hydroxychromene-2-carboxylate isomerase [Paracoccaceae bacterium]MCB2122131.1 2-hydroxychromene-2-carboxylate isomerase [Paracoccaceae bacterium]
MAHIDYYFSTISPFAYLAGSRLEEIAQRHGATITYKPVDIGALLARTGGTALADRHDSRKEYRLQELRRQAAKAGMPINLRPMFFPTNAAPAAYAIIAAQAKGNGDLGGLVQGVLRACWAEDRNIAEDEVVTDLLKAHGFDPGIAFSAMLMGAETYGRNLEDALGAGVFGSPFYVVDTGERFWGQDRLDDLDLYLAGKL